MNHATNICSVSLPSQIEVNPNSCYYFWVGLVNTGGDLVEWADVVTIETEDMDADAEEHVFDVPEPIMII